MFVSDVMTTNVVTISGDTSLADAHRIIEAHRIRRLPVVDRGKLVGIVSRDTLEKSGPSRLSTFSMHEASYLLSKITVREVMKREVLTVPPDTTIEEAVALAQSRKVGALVVLEGDRVVGIVTTNDIFYKVVNPLLGIDRPGIRFSVHKWQGTKDLGKMIAVLDQFKCDVVNIYARTGSDGGENEVLAHLATSDPVGLVDALRKAGFEVRMRSR